MEKIRGFEKVTMYQDDAILPVRATKGAAGYDFTAVEDVWVPSIWKQGIALALKAAWQGQKNEYDETLLKQVKPTMVPTGVKAYMGDSEYLQIANRSSGSQKNFLSMPNGVGIIDSDYYGNPKNEGHIMFQFINFGLTDKLIKKGDRIGQGIFLPFLKADNDTATGIRNGGFGSTGQS